MAQVVVDPTPENTAFNLTNYYEAEVRAWYELALNVSHAHAG